MKRILLLLLMYMVSLFGYSQGFYIDKDVRIHNIQKDVVGFLIKQKEIDSVKKRPYDAPEYLGSIYIAKQMDFYSRCDNVLLIRFGSLGDHANSYWGVITKVNRKDTLYFFNEGENLKSLGKSFPDCDTTVMKAMFYFIDEREKSQLDMF